MTSSKSLTDVIRSVIEKEPDITVFALNQILKEKNFVLEELDPLQILASFSTKASDMFSITNDLISSSENYSQIVPSGNYQYVKNICSVDEFEYVSEYAKQTFSKSDIAPLCHVLSTKDACTFKYIIKSICSNFLSVNAKANEFGNFSVIGSRCFLRRTYPLAHSQVKGNINNQNWHQDSNPLFNSKPMATIWIPLDKGCGYECPGLDISSINVNKFIPTFGDGCEVIPELEYSDFKTSIEPNIVTLQCNILDGIVFNGLSFHRTSYSHSMHKSRDVLIIRIAPSTLIHDFPGNREYDFTI